MSDSSLLAAAITVILDEEEREKVFVEERKKHIDRKIWVSDFLQTRSDRGFFVDLNGMLRNGNPKLYENFVRMNSDDFDVLLNLVTPLIEKQDTTFRSSISAAERLALTLRFLAIGDSYINLMYLFRVSMAAISGIIEETCDALYHTLRKEYMKVNSSFYFLFNNS